MVDYPLTDFIRKGQGKLKTGRLGEATPCGTFINLVDMTQWDAGDAYVGIVICPIDQNVAQVHNVDIPINTEVYYLDMTEAFGCEVKLIDAGAGFTVGDAIAITTAGDVMTFAYVDAAVATDTLINVVGKAMATAGANAAAWVKLGK